MRNLKKSDARHVKAYQQYAGVLSQASNVTSVKNVVNCFVRIILPYRIPIRSYGLKNG